MNEQIPETGSSWPQKFCLVGPQYITCFTSPFQRQNLEVYPTFL